MIGSEFARPDAWAKASGRALYTADLQIPGMLHGVVARAAVPAARISSIDVSDARDTPGVVCVVTAADLAARAQASRGGDEPVLAAEVIRYFGEPFALVAAESEDSARQGVAVIRLDYESKPAVLCLEEATKSRSPRVHDNGNVMQPALVRRGDVASAFSAAPVVVAGSYRSQRVHQAYLEPRAAIAEIDADGRLVVTTSSQAPFAVRSHLADLLGFPLHRIRIRTPAVGGGFGGKLRPGMATYAAVLCLETGRPVKVVCSQAEEMQAANPREGSIIALESAVDEHGRILARRATVYLDAGAYATDTPVIASTAALLSCGPYEIEAIEAAVYPVYTNTTPTGAFRAPSAPQMVFANEMHMEEIAMRLGLSSVEIRRRNIIRDGGLGPTGQRVEQSAMAECLESVAAEIERWRRARRPTHAASERRGYGLACGWWMTMPGHAAATVSVGEDGTLTVCAGSAEIGTGALASGIAAIAADALGVEVGDVRVVCGDTDVVPLDVGSDGSRTLYGVGNAVQRAVAEVRAMLAQHAAEHFEANAADLHFKEKRVEVAGSPTVSMSLAACVRLCVERTGPVIGKGIFQSPPSQYDASCTERMAFTTMNEPSFHCQGVEIGVATDTGKIRVIRVIAAHDTGPVVNPAGVRGQIEGGVIQGIGYALLEEIRQSKTGLVENGTFGDYGVPTAADIPDEISIIPIEGYPSLHGPLGVKGVGEPPVMLAAAAIGAALYDATGIRAEELPLSPERISALLCRTRLRAAESVSTSETTSYQID